jgi:hypothetical protein
MVPLPQAMDGVGRSELRREAASLSFSVRRYAPAFGVRVTLPGALKNPRPGGINGDPGEREMRFLPSGIPVRSQRKIPFQPCERLRRRRVKLPGRSRRDGPGSMFNPPKGISRQSLFPGFDPLEGYLGFPGIPTAFPPRGIGR